MTGHPFPSQGRASGPRDQRGFTLIEMMVAMVISMILAVVVLLVQRSLSQQKSRGSDVAQRDTEARAAMDLISHDVSSAGFLFGGMNNPCGAVTHARPTGGLMTFNAAGFYTHYAVDAVPSAVGGTMPFAPTLTMTYPAAGSGISSDVLVLTSAAGATAFANSDMAVSPNTAFDPMGTGVLPLSGFPQTPQPPQVVTVGDVGVLQVPASGERICMRVPITTVNAGAVSVASAGPTMPSSFYAGFAGQLTANGFAGSLSNAEIYQGKFLDLGPPTPTLPLLPVYTTIAYYVDSSVAAWPTLMQGTYNLLDDSLIATQPIAAGVVALQVRFGVDPAATGQVTAYETAAQVQANKHRAAVLTVRVTVFTRTLYPDATYTNPSATVTGPDGLASITVPAGYQHFRFTAQQVETGVRNLQWLK